MIPRAAHRAALSPVGAAAVPLALAYMFLVFVLPPRFPGTFGYALIMLSASATYSLIFFRQICERPPPVEWLLLAGLAGAYLALSYLGMLRLDDRLFARGRVLPQAAGLLLMLVSLPIFMHASRTLLIPRPRVVPILIIMAGVTFSVMRWQGVDHILRPNGLYGVLSPGLMLQFGYFLIVTRASGKLARCILLILPLPLMLAASNFLIQLALVLSVLLPRPQLLVTYLVPAVVVSTLVIAYPPDFLAPYIASDDNTLVRSRLWSQAIAQIMQHPLGTGFGQSSVPVSALKDPWIRHVFSQEASRSLEVSNHNTFLDMALRLGWAGLLLFLLLLRRLWRQAGELGMETHAVAAISTAILACAFNPVLESVRSAFFFAFALGYLATMRGAVARNGWAQAARSASTGEALTPAERRRQRAAEAA